MNSDITTSNPSTAICGLFGSGQGSLSRSPFTIKLTNRSFFLGVHSDLTEIGQLLKSELGMR